MVKRKSRGDESTEKDFTFGPSQYIPSDFNELLKISSFKRELLHFFYEDPVYGVILGKKVCYCATDNEFKKFYSDGGVLKSEGIYDFYGYHLEDDTRVMFHTIHAGLIDPGNIDVRRGDMDIDIILSCNVEKLENSHLWYNNSHECIDINIWEYTIYENIRIYAFSRNDDTPEFFQKGKIRSIELMQKNEKFVDVFTSLGDIPLNTDTLDALEDMVM